MAQARIERKSKFTMMLAENETKMLAALCNLQGVSAASLIRKLILDEYGRRVLTQRIATDPLNPAFTGPAESTKSKKPKRK
jgi:uridine phosphorylase